eukprot:TRINITY_DN34704_c0_g1_i1.p1 TRINITY_DN34704_c0_g1~~TRINITY_DN34704_c0_g1_i1.p1  ORF type:complete len:373 (-),score=33.79 TRINITY_DN34704_c0_g1_i1:62-1180(-)
MSCGEVCQDGTATITSMTGEVILTMPLEATTRVLDIRDAIRAHSSRFKFCQLVYEGDVLADCQASVQDLAMPREVTAWDLRKERNDGCSASRLKTCYFSAEDLKEAGYSIYAIKHAGYSVEESFRAGFSPKELKEAGYSVASLCALLRALGGVQDLKTRGYDVEFLVVHCGLNGQQVLDLGFSFKDIVADLPHDKLSQMGFSAHQFEEAGFPVSLVMAVGFSAVAAFTGGYHPRDIYTCPACTSNIGKVYKLSRSLKASGMSAIDLIALGCPARMLVTLGFSPDEFRQAVRPTVCPATQSERAGRAPEDVHSAIQVLRTWGFDAKSLLLDGYKAHELLDAGYSLNQLLFSNCVPPDEFRELSQRKRSRTIVE